jgi:hypothetical protein
VASYCEMLVCVKGGEFLDHLIDCQRLKEDSTQWSSVWLLGAFKTLSHSWQINGTDLNLVYAAIEEIKRLNELGYIYSRNVLPHL